MREKAIFCWSGGKDSALALSEVLDGDEFEIVSLVSTLSREFDRVSHHGVRRELLEQQAVSLGLPLEMIFLESTCDMRAYEERMEAWHLDKKAQGIGTVVFGDIFLRDLRARREENLARVGLTAHFPLWNRPTHAVVGAFLERGFEAIVCAVDTRKLTSECAGKPLDRAFLESLPEGVDPCGEHGEFHSFVWRGPIFRQDIPVKAGELVVREDRAFRELLPVDS